MANSTEHTESTSVLGMLVQRLRSQPLLLALGVVLVLATVATASVDGLRALLPAAVAVTLVSMGAWVIVEIVRLRTNRRTTSERVHLSARGVSDTGEVIGIDDESGNAAPGTSVNLKARDVSGRVVGVRRGPRSS